MSSTRPGGDVRTELTHEVAALRRRASLVTVVRLISYLAYAWVVVSLLILGFGFVLLLFGANPDAGFTRWVYRHLVDVMEPFRGIFPQQTAPGGATLDTSVLFAMVVYALIAAAVRGVVDWLTWRRDVLRHRIARDDDLRRRVDLDREPRSTYGPPRDPRS